MANITQPLDSLPPPLPSDQEASGRSFGSEELTALQQVLDSGILTATKGQWAKKLESQFAELLGAAHCHACSSGTAAIHCAIAAIDPEPGDEIITSPITDMGAISPIIYQGAIPVFADVDPLTLNITADAISRCLSPRTKAIIVTHLFGNPCAMDEIILLARARGIPVIEDCAQAFLAKYDNRYVGTWGDIGVFSLQQGKHITCGEGGLLVSNSPNLARRSYLFINKAWGYGDRNPDHYFLALNYRTSELQAAVALAQLGKLQTGIDARISAAKRLTTALDGLPGITLPQASSSAEHVFWRYIIHVDAKRLRGGNDALAAVLKEKGIFTAPRYIKKPAFCCEVLREQKTFGNSRFPFNLARPQAVDYSETLFPGAFSGLSTVLVLPWCERYTNEHVDFIADSIINAVNYLS